MKNALTSAAIAAAIAVAGCGGDSNQALSYDDFGDEVSALCAEQAVEVTGRTGELSGDPKQDAPIFAEQVETVERINEDFEALDPPAELDAAYDEFLAANAKIIENTREMQELAEAGDRQALVAAGQDPVRAREGASFLEAASRVGATCS